MEYLENPKGIETRKPRFSWKLKSNNQNSFNQRQRAFRILVASSPDLLDTLHADQWDSKWVRSNRSNLITYEGKMLESDEDYFWMILIKDENSTIGISKDIASFSTGLLDKEDWTADWVGTNESFDPSEGENKMFDPWFRKRFYLKERADRATLFVASIGYHEIYVNGVKIGDQVLAPAVTDHSKRARYVAYDIGSQLKKGENVIGIWLGTSWSIFSSYETEDKPRTPLVRAQTDIYKEDPREPILRLETDATWKSHPSPNKLIGDWSFGHYGGELWDSNKDIADWNDIGFIDKDWEDVVVYNPDLILSAQQVEPNYLYDEIHPKSIKLQNDRSYLVDMGVNFAGWTNIKVNGNPGDTIRMWFSEREGQKETFGLHNLYVLDSSGSGIFKNKFNYSSGRWITIEGMKEAPKSSDIIGWNIRTGYKEITRFETSDQLQNWIYNTTLWNFKNLSLGGYVVDCPQRERFGYGGDAHATSETGILNFDLGAFYTKWLQDWRDMQGTESTTGHTDISSARVKITKNNSFEEGVLPHTAPTYRGGGGPAWGGISVTLPWFLYEYYGDEKVLRENFEMVKKWLSFLHSHAEDNMLKRFGGKWDFLGDWLWPNATEEGMNNDSEENLFFNNCYWIYNLKTAAKIAKILGEEEFASLWEKQAALSSSVLHEKYYDTVTHNYSDHSMRSLAAALYGNIMPSEIRPQVMESLENEILVKQKGYIDVGITGGAMLFKVLREEQRDDLLLTMTSQTTYPSWGYMKEEGATTLWEAWEGLIPGHSMLHSSYLYPGAWYIEGMAGIRKDDRYPGFERFKIVVPHLPNRDTFSVSAEFDSPKGLIESSWRKKDSMVELKVSIPPNTSAHIYFPYSEGKEIFVNSDYAKKIGLENDYVVFKVPSGNYYFHH